MTDATFALLAGEPLGAGLERILATQLSGSRALLARESAGEQLDAVHETRKALKRLRAVLRLVRPSLDGEAYRRLDDRLRETARHLAGARDAEVMLATLDALEHRHAGRLSPEPLAELRVRLAFRHERERFLIAQNGSATTVTAELAALEQGIGEWGLQSVGAGTLRRGFVRVYRRGRRDWKAVRHEPTTEALHSFRRAVKHLRHGAEVLTPVAPKRMGRLAKRADLLGELLGEDHDFALLAQLTTESLEEHASAELLSAIADSRRELQRDALRLARRLYRRRPRAVDRRLRRALRRWLKDSRPHDERDRTAADHRTDTPGS